MKVFEKRLKAERESKKKLNSKWTQGYVASIIGVARTTYTAYENGSKEPPFDTLNKIADLFGLSIDYLQGRTDVKSVSRKDDDSRNIFVKDSTHRTFINEYIEAPEEHKQKLTDYWMLLRDAEKGRKLGARQNE